jgi:hypothetical protein
MNCGKPLGSNQAELFAEVMVCKPCHDIAASIYDRGQLLLRRLSILLKDTVRYGLKSGQVQLPMVDAEIVNDHELLCRIVGLYFQDNQWQTPSSKSIEPSAPAGSS